MNTVVSIGSITTAELTQAAAEKLHSRAERFACEVQGFAWCVENPVDVLVVDAELAGASGLDIFRQIRQIPGREHVAGILVTEKGDKWALYEALDAGLNDVVTKPVDKVELLGRLQNLLHLRSGFRGLEEKVSSLESQVDKSLDDLREANTYLNKRVQEESERCLQQQHIILQRTRVIAMGEMLSAVAHHWRQPLTVVSLLVESLRMDYDEGTLSSTGLQQYAEDIINELKMLSGTIDTFRNILKPDASKVRFELEEALKSVLIFIWPQLKDNNIRITLEDTSSHVSLFGYPREFQQVLLSIIGNSRDAIILARKPGRILIHVEQTAGEVIIAISDNGGGIDESVLARIFDPYFTTRERGVGSGVVRGTGTELYLAKIVIEEKMAGVISVENTSEGTRTTIRLPLSIEVQ